MARDSCCFAGGLGEGAGGVKADGLAAGVELACGFPVPADGGVGQPGVMCRHFGSLVIEDLLDDMLGDVTVDEGCPQRVAELVRGEPDRGAVMAADVAACQPAAEPAAVGVAVRRHRAGDVLRGAGEQDRGPAGPAGCVPLPLPPDPAGDFVVDGDEGLAFHLVVVVAQVGLPVAVADDAVRWQRAGVPDAQSAPDQDERDQAAAGIVPPVQAGGVLDLGHDVPGEGPGQSFPAFGVVLGEDHGAGGQAGTHSCWRTAVRNPLRFSMCSLCSFLPPNSACRAAR